VDPHTAHNAAAFAEDSPEPPPLRSDASTLLASALLLLLLLLPVCLLLPSFFLLRGGALLEGLGEIGVALALESKTLSAPPVKVDATKEGAASLASLFSLLSASFKSKRQPSRSKSQGLNTRPLEFFLRNSEFKWVHHKACSGGTARVFPV
jgi:hypothetical protein